MASGLIPSAPTLEDMPNEMILRIINSLTPRDRINLALSKPSRFLSSEFNMWRYDATQVAQRQQSLRPVPRVETPQDQPLIYTAIFIGKPLEVIEQMLDIYIEICGVLCLSGIWGRYVSVLRPLLHPAIDSMRIDVIHLLLAKGADPSYMHKDGGIQHICSLSGFTHRQCRPAVSASESETTSDQPPRCDNALLYLLQKQIIHLRNIERRRENGKVFVLDFENHFLKNAQDVALTLFHHGASPLIRLSWRRAPVANEQGLTVQERVNDQFYYAIKANMTSLVKAIAEQDDQLTHFSVRDSFPGVKLDLALQACCEQFSDAHRGTLEYLIEVGAPLKGEPPQVTPFPDCYLLDWALGKGHISTAEYLLHLHIQKDVPIRFEDLAVRELTYEEPGIGRTKPLPLAFVQLLFQAIGEGHFSKWYNGRSPRLLQQDLLDMHARQPRYSFEAPLGVVKLWSIGCGGVSKDIPGAIGNFY
ncbi:hypothetical protein F5Y18DRAFT_434682 [Xylariaceae sp. FL1019]|nr:hypothetical protein F5Y18DRAFT_434682 [Xylariaceae sp. FL1019]